MTVRAIVMEAITEIARVAPPASSSPQRLAQDLGIDSLDFVRLVQVIEDRLDITLGDEQAAGVVTVDDLVLLCEATVAQSANG